MSRSLLALLAALAALLPATARADFVFSRPVTLAEPQAAAPDLAADPIGNTTIVWQERGDDPMTWLIQAARLSSAGTLAPPLTLAAQKNVSSPPQVVVDGLGRATVAWQAEDQVWAVHLDAGGVPIAPVETLSPTGEGVAQLQLELAVDSQGRVTVVWGMGGGLGDPPGRIESVRLLPDGTSEPAQTLSEPGVDSSSPGLTVDQEDRAVVAWDSADGLQLIRFDGEGAPGPVQTVLPPEANAGVPSVVVDSQGRATIGYWTFPGLDAKAVRVGPKGSVGPVLDLSPEDENAFPPLVAADSADRITTVWESFSGQIETARIAPDGMLGPVRIVSDPDLHSAGGPQLATLPGNKAVVVWALADPLTLPEPPPAPECEEGERENDAVQAAFIGEDGIPGPIHQVSAFGEQSFGPAVVAGPLGNVSVAWESFDGTYFCERPERRLQLSWGPWSPPVPEEPPADPGPTGGDPPLPIEPLVAASVRLGRKAVARDRFVVVRGVCLGSPSVSCSSRIRLVAGKAKEVIASGRVRLQVGARRVLRLRLSRHGRDLLADRGSRAIRARIEGVAVTTGKLLISPGPAGGGPAG
jgi:hypothetical protein